MDRTPGAQSIATFVNTALADCATFARVQDRPYAMIESPIAFDITSKAAKDALVALHTAARAPLTGPMYWREAPLPGGRVAQVFNCGGGTSCQVRRADGTTEYSMTYIWESRALEDFATVVCLAVEEVGLAR
jgi:hypothetical protein